jgi:hypothetical protein
MRLLNITTVTERILRVQYDENQQYFLFSSDIV